MGRGRNSPSSDRSGATRAGAAREATQLVQTAKLASIGELATGIADELNNVLNNVGLFVGNAMDYIKLDKPKEVILDDLQTTLKQVHRGADILTHLRAFGRPAPAKCGPSPSMVPYEPGSVLSGQLRVRNIRGHPRSVPG